MPAGGKKKSWKRQRRAGDRSGCLLDERNDKEGHKIGKKIENVGGTIDLESRWAQEKIGLVGDRGKGRNSRL